MWPYHRGGAKFIIGLLWIVCGMQNVTTTGHSNAKGTSSKFVKAPEHNSSVAFVLQSFLERRKLKCLQRKITQDLVHPLLLLYHNSYLTETKNSEGKVRNTYIFKEFPLRNSKRKILSMLTISTST